jgi:hydroxyacylglutathione hydrolase/adenylyltransferase/sulfurtransferase
MSDPDLEVTPEHTRRALEDGTATVIDVREDYEHQAGRIDGARHIVFDQLTAQAPTIDAGKPVIFHCRVGSRSAVAAQAFRQVGYDAYSMAGGLVAWHDEGLPMEGEVAPH